MANSNNICTRFINYVAVLILVFLSSQSFAVGGSFGGAGASGSWGESLPDTVKPTISCDSYRASGGNASNQPTANQACQVAHGKSGFWGGTFGEYSSTRKGCFGNNYYLLSGLACNGEKLSCPPEYRLQGSLCILNDNACPAGYEKDANGKCQPKKCPVGETLVNGQCQKKQCPAGQALDTNGNCMSRDDQCPAGQIMVNGRCTIDPNKDDDPPPEGSELPPFCEWASVMCQWHQEWQQWSNDYSANEQKANLDREELKRLSLDSKEQLTEINLKQDAIKEAIQNQSLTLDQIKQEDKQFYDELRLWLRNFDPEQGTPSEEYPPVEFPEFCNWSVQVCNWYLDWKDWRTDYNANNDVLKQKLDQHLERLQEIKEQDAEHYQETKSFFNRAREFFDETLTFFDEIRDFLAQQGNDADDDPSGEITPEQQDIQVDETKRINFVSSCPAGEQFTVSFMGSTQNLEFSYQPLCQFMSMIRPFVIAIAYLIGAYIVMGLSRGSSE